MNDVERVVLVLLPEVLQNPDLLLSLAVKPLLVPHHFQSHMVMVFVVVSLHHLTEAAFANHFEHFVTVGEVVVDDVRVGALLVIVAAVVGASDDARPLLGVGADEVDLRIVEYLVVLVGSQFAHVQLHHLFRRGHHHLGFAVLTGGGRRGVRRVGPGPVLGAGLYRAVLEVVIGGAVGVGSASDVRQSLHSVEVDRVGVAAGAPAVAGGAAADSGVGVVHSVAVGHRAVGGRRSYGVGGRHDGGTGGDGVQVFVVVVDPVAVEAVDAVLAQTAAKVVGRVGAVAVVHLAVAVAVL